MAKLKNIEDVVSHTCRHCRWWSPNPMELKQDWGACQGIDFGATSFMPPADGLIAIDAVDIITGPDFGCVHWVSKDG